MWEGAHAFGGILNDALRYFPTEKQTHWKAPVVDPFSVPVTYPADVGYSTSCISSPSF